MRGATYNEHKGGDCYVVSIHAPHAGRDIEQRCRVAEVIVFQSTRPMRGATWRSGKWELVERPFQSTRPMRGATGNATGIG